MASILKVDKIVDSGSNVLATSSGSGHTIDSGVTNNAGVASGTIASGVTFPAGHVLQIVTKEYTGETSYSSTSYEDTFMTWAITPKYSNSNILIYMTTLSGNNSATLSHYSKYRMKRTVGSTSTTLTGEWHGDRVYYAQTPVVFNKLDSPATTSEVTYMLQIKRETSSINYIGLNGTISFISFTEIAG